MGEVVNLPYMFDLSFDAFRHAVALLPATANDVGDPPLIRHAHAKKRADP